MILDNFPTTEDFYKTYWGKKPFIVRGYIPEEKIAGFIDGNTLAGLSLEDNIKSRIITNSDQGDNWACEHGPFEDGRYDDIGDKNWSVLVQNVEQYHHKTGDLLSYFQFSPRWLLDDIMISFSAPGGSVGPHTDSYHTFLVQGVGKRTWKISNSKINDDRYVDNPDMKILENGFDGDTYEVNIGDVIYMPPFFGHEGKTLEAAMTFSIGFLGPKLSEMMYDYAQYLEQNDDLNKRFLGENINAESAASIIDDATKQNILQSMTSSLQQDHFSTWIASYFSTISHEEIEDSNPIEDETLLDSLKNGAGLNLHNHVKIAITQSSNSDYNIALFGESISVSAKHKKLITKLNERQTIIYDDLKNNSKKSIDLIFKLNTFNIFTLN